LPDDVFARAADRTAMRTRAAVCYPAVFVGHAEIVLHSRSYFRRVWLLLYLFVRRRFVDALL
jgi:hypothetical protein